MMDSKEYGKYIFLLLFVFVIYLSYLIIKPFLTALVASAILAYIFYPMYRWLTSKIKKKNISALIISIFIIIIFAVPLVFTAQSLAKESQVLFIGTKQIFTTGDVFKIGCAEEDSGMICTFSNWVKEKISDPKVRYHIEESVEKITTQISESASSVILFLPTIILSLFITFFTLFYFFKDGPKFIEKIMSVLPLKPTHQKKVVNELNDAMHAIIYGSLLVALIQGFVGGIGFYLFGISSPITWGIMMAIFALIPFIGTAIIWLPIAMILLVKGFAISSNSLIFKGIGLILFGALIVGSLDNILKPYIIGKKSKIHPVLVLLGVLGGIAVFGFMGFIVGPLILAILMTLLEIYESEKSRN